jgi:hypothetical protein
MQIASQLKFCQLLLQRCDLWDDKGRVQLFLISTSSQPVMIGSDVYMFGMMMMITDAAKIPGRGGKWLAIIGPR